jgi:thymidylate kinase
MNKIYITGISGTGKTTITNALQKKGVTAYSIDEVPGLCTWVNKQDGSTVDYEAVLDLPFIQSHAWMCDLPKLQELLNSSDVVAVAGLAENQAEMLPLFNTIILLQCRPEVVIPRILQRTDNTFGHDEGAQKHIRTTYKAFEHSMLEHGAIPVNAEASIEKVVDEILKIIANYGSTAS